MSEIEQKSQILSRRRVLNLASASIGTLVASPALADSLADVPPREPGADLSAHSERSKYVKIDRIPEAGPGLRNVDPDNAINAKTPYATTLFDYIHRAMPYPAPGSLSTDDTYAVTAYILSLNGIIPADGKVDKLSLPHVKMPNRDGFVPDPEFDPARLFGKN